MFQPHGLPMLQIQVDIGAFESMSSFHDFINKEQYKEFSSLFSGVHLSLMWGISELLYM